MYKSIGLSVVVLFIFCSLASADLVDNGDGTVVDTATGLVWQQAEPGTMTWEAALVYCEDLTLAGHDDWRLPNRNELQTLVDYDAVDPAMDTVRFPGAVSSGYWSSTTYIHNTDLAWCVYFSYGWVYCGNKSNSHYVRAVRGGQ